MVFRRSVILLFIVLGFSSSGFAAARWEKGLKISGWANLYNTALSNNDWHFQVDGNFIKRFPFASWGNQFTLLYGEQEISQVRSISPNEWRISEAYRRDISAFSYWNVYFRASSALSIPAGVTRVVYSDSGADYGWSLSRYTILSTGLMLSKQITPENEGTFSWVTSLKWEKQIGYYNKVLLMPLVEQDLKATENTVVGLTAEYSYKLGDKLTFVAGGTYKYNIHSKQYTYKAGAMNLMYDVYRW